MKTYLRTSALLCCFIALFSSPASAMPGQLPSLSQRPGLALVREAVATLLQLDLSTAQRTEIKAILGSRQDEIINGASLVVEARTNLFAAIHADAYDEEAIRRASAEVAAAEEQLAILRAKLVHQIRPVMTNAQRELLAEKRETLGDKFKGLTNTMKERFVAWLAAPVE